MKMGHYELFVKDPKESRNFYCNILGFESVSDQGEFQWVKLGDREILLRPGSNPSKVEVYENSGGAIVLYTEDIQKSENELKSKGLIFKGTDGSDGCLTFTDPDGHWFQLVNPNH